MTRRVEFRLAARADIRRFEKFLKKLSERAAARRVGWLETQVLSLGSNPRRGQEVGRNTYLLVLRYDRARYIVRYRVTDTAVVILRIWHGKENRPR